MNRHGGPADTRIMGVVHGALRRDLERVRDVVTTEPFPLDEQRRALGDHVVWLMDFLHAHHDAEDRGLWPMVRERNPAAGELLDSLEADHQRIEPAAASLRTAGRQYAEDADDQTRIALIAAIDTLAEVLFPHLDREVTDAMPVVSATLTQAEWHRLDQAYNIKPKSMAQLAMEAHWVLDGIDEEGYDVVMRTVPRMMRFVLLHGLGGPYRRTAQVRWAGTGTGSVTTP
jgi:hypothetical protein